MKAAPREKRSQGEKEKGSRGKREWRKKKKWLKCSFFTENKLSSSLQQCPLSFPCHWINFILFLFLSLLPFFPSSLYVLWSLFSFPHPPHPIKRSPNYNDFFIHTKRGRKDEMMMKGWREIKREIGREIKEERKDEKEIKREESIPWVDYWSDERIQIERMKFPFEYWSLHEWTYQVDPYPQIQ